MRLKRIIGAWLALVLWASTGQGALTTGDICFVCQKEIRFTVYTWADKVRHTKIRLCFNCTELPDNCYLCSVPVLKNHKTLPDGRVICQRDLDSAVLDDRQAVQICDAVKEKLERQFIRFLSFPETKTTVQLMDRVHLQELFKVIGNDFSCPNTLGCTETKTNQGRREFVISILSGQPQEEVMTTCVHEYAHTWIIENVPAARHKTIGKDAIEGFCELLAYLFAEQQGLHNGKSNILANHYTRGQIHLFIAAHAQYGLPDIIDWMMQGDDPLLLRGPEPGTAAGRCTQAQQYRSHRQTADHQNRNQHLGETTRRCPAGAPALASHHLVAQSTVRDHQWPGVRGERNQIGVIAPRPDHHQMHRNPSAFSRAGNKPFQRTPDA